MILLHAELKNEFRTSRIRSELKNEFRTSRIHAEHSRTLSKRILKIHFIENKKQQTTT
jgi:hypothetical protein